MVDQPTTSTSDQPETSSGSNNILESVILSEEFKSSNTDYDYDLQNYLENVSLETY